MGDGLDQGWAPGEINRRLFRRGPENEALAPSGPKRGPAVGVFVVADQGAIGALGFLLGETKDGGMGLFDPAIAGKDDGGEAVEEPEALENTGETLVEIAEDAIRNLSLFQEVEGGLNVVIKRPALGLLEVVVNGLKVWVGGLGAAGVAENFFHHGSPESEGALPIRPIARAGGVSSFRQNFFPDGPEGVFELMAAGLNAILAGQVGVVLTHGWMRAEESGGDVEVNKGWHGEERAPGGMIGGLVCRVRGGCVTRFQGREVSRVRGAYLIRR